MVVVLIMMLFLLVRFEEASMDSFHGILTFGPCPEFLVLFSRT